MALMLGQLYDALRAGDVPDDKARAAAEEVANYEGEIGKLRLELGVRADVRLLKWMVGFVTAVQLGTLALVWQILVRSAAMIAFTIASREAEAKTGETVWQVARRDAAVPAMRE